MTTNVWMPVAMLQECIGGKRVLLNGLYEDRITGYRVVAERLVMGKSTLYVDFHDADAPANMPEAEMISVKKFYRKFRLVGVR